MEEREGRSDLYEGYNKLEATFEEKLKIGAKTVWKYMSAIIAVGIAIWWIFYGTVKIVPTEISIVERIGLTICTVVLAVTYCKLISSGGFNSGRETQEYKTAYKEWQEAVKRGNSHKKEINEYAKEMAKYNVKTCRTENLEEFGLNYKDFFDEDGKFINPDFYKDNLLTRKQKRVIRKCLRLKVIAPKVFGEISGKYFGMKKEETQKEFATKHDLRNFAVRATVSIVSVGFMFNFLGFSIGSMMYAFFQIVMWTGSGVAQRMQNYDFIVLTELPQIQERTLIINGYLDTHKEVKENARQELLRPIEGRELQGAPKEGSTTISSEGQCVQVHNELVE